jgi:hypothetical protein
VIADGEGKTLQYYGPINIDVELVHLPSMLKAFVGIILLAEVVSTWFHTSPTSAKALPGRSFGVSPTAAHVHDTAIVQAHSYHSTIIAGSYQALPLDPRLCHFHRTFVCHAP